MQRCKEISLIDFHDWVLCKVVFLLCLIIFLECQWCHRAYVTTDLSRYEVALRLIKDFLWLQEKIKVKLVWILWQTIAHDRCCSHSNTLILVKFQKFEQNSFAFFTTCSKHARNKLSINVAFFDQSDKYGQATCFPDQLPKPVQHGKVLNPLNLIASRVISLREYARCQDYPLNGSYLQ